MSIYRGNKLLLKERKVQDFIKNIRTDNGLTQQELASKLGVTYQAVSKWENGRSIPSLSKIRLISKLFKVDASEIVDLLLALELPDNNHGKRTRKRRLICGLVATIILFLLGLVVHFASNKLSVEFRTVSSSDQNFTISGVVAFSKNKASIYISNLKYLQSDTAKYKTLECALYETKDNKHKKIGQCSQVSESREDNDESNQLTTLSKLLEGVSFKADNYSAECKKFSSGKFYLEIIALDKDDQNIVHKVPLELVGDCQKIQNSTES